MSLVELLKQELKGEWEYMKRIVGKVKKKLVRKKLIKRKDNIMSDSDYQAGMTAAINAYQASVSYASTGFSYTYTPPVPTAPVSPAPETVTVF